MGGSRGILEGESLSSWEHSGGGGGGGGVRGCTFLLEVPPSRRSLILQGFGLDVVGDPPASGQRQDGVVDGGHFHSQGDGVLVLAVHRAVVLAQREEEGVVGEGQTFTPWAQRRAPPPPPPPVPYLCRGSGLQSVKAKRSAQRSLVEIGQVAGLGGWGGGERRGERGTERTGHVA